MARASPSEATTGRRRVRKWTARWTRFASRKLPGPSARFILRLLNRRPPRATSCPTAISRSALTGWRGDNYGDIHLVWEATGGAASGQLCLHSLNELAPTSSRVVYSRPFPAHPGRHYTFSCRVKCGSGSYSPRFEVQGCGGRAGFVSVYTQCPSATTSWSQATYSFTLPSNFSFALPVRPHRLPKPRTPALASISTTCVSIASDSMTALALKDKITVGPLTFPIGNLYIYTPGATTATTLTISNTDTVAHNVTVQPTITNWEEKQVPGLASLGMVTVPANSADDHQLWHGHQSARNFPAWFRSDLRRSDLASERRGQVRRGGQHAERRNCRQFHLRHEHAHGEASPRCI